MSSERGAISHNPSQRCNEQKSAPSANGDCQHKSVLSRANAISFDPNDDDIIYECLASCDDGSLVTQRQESSLSAANKLSVVSPGTHEPQLSGPSKAGNENNDSSARPDAPKDFSRSIDGDDDGCTTTPVEFETTDDLSLATAAECGKRDRVLIRINSGHPGLDEVELNSDRLAVDSNQLGQPLLAASSSALDLRQLNTLVGHLDNGNSGSLSDNSYQRRARKEAELERRQMEEKLRNWKRSNKIITHITENPFNLHLDCLERLGRLDNHPVNDSQLQSARDSVKFSLHSKNEGLAETITNSHRHGERQHQDTGENCSLMNDNQHDNNQGLQNYASHLSSIYKKNQAIMDSNKDFRSLLYNIICCLLIQDDQVLSTPSVTKMIDVIRTHLESASKSYASAISAASYMEDHQKQQAIAEAARSQLPDIPPGVGPGTVRGAGSVESGLLGNECIGGIWATTTRDVYNQTTQFVQMMPERSRRPVDFRRISSVSYNDEQLINDLCDCQQSSAGCGTDGSRCSGQSESKCPDSPWRFEELWSEYKHHNSNTDGITTQSSSAHHTSQSSLENNSSAGCMDLMNDSGVGTLFESGQATADDTLSRSYHNRRHSVSSKSNENSIKVSSMSNRKRHSDAAAGQFRPKQQPSYMSTDEYSMTDRLYADSNRTQLYDEDATDRSTSQKIDSNELKTVDVASRRAELEWTLNKLINFELKYTWLASRDTLRRGIRKIGVPNEIRSKVWLILIEQLIGTKKYDIPKILEEARRTIESEDQGCPLDDETQSILKQIELDVNRTMPGHKLFDDGAEGGVKLRRILVAYSIHVNRAIAYCQGFNFIVALLLSVFDGDEEKSLRGLVCIVDHIFPSKFYFDHYLTGARADQFLLADFICDQLIKNPTTDERKMVEGVTSSITLNWFISLFHGAVPTLTRLTILDHFMLEGVKALFRFTMAILYLAFQVTPPSSCEVFTAIRNTAKDMYDIKLLLSIVEQIKLPKDSYFAIRRSFYMVQSSFNSDQFYMQSLSQDSGRQLVSNKPLSIQQLPDTKPPAMSFITAASLVAHQSFGCGDSHNVKSSGNIGPRVCTSSDRSKVCVQNIGKLGRSHLKIMDANVKSNERSLMCPLRNCLVIGVSNCGKFIIVARRSSRRNFKTFKEQDLIFHVHELSTEIFDGFYLENCKIALVVTQNGEIVKIDTSKCFADSHAGSTETLMLRDSHSIDENEKVKLKLASVDVLTNLLWIYVECDEINYNLVNLTTTSPGHKDFPQLNACKEPHCTDIRSECRFDNPFPCNAEDILSYRLEGHQARPNHRKKILIIDIVTFDLFSAFSIDPNFGEIINLRSSLLAFCQLGNPFSNQFSSKIVQIGPTGRYDQLLSFSDVVDYMIDVPESYKKKQDHLESSQKADSSATTQRYSTIRKFLNQSMSLNHDDGDVESAKSKEKTAGTLTRYYRSLMRSHTTAIDDYSPNQTSSTLPNQPRPGREDESFRFSADKRKQGDATSLCSAPSDHNRGRVELFKGVIESHLGGLEQYTDTCYMPANMAFIFRNGKIALFEFTESYAIHTRESQLDRYDYSKVIDVKKNDSDFIVTILTIYDKLIKVVI